MKQLTRICVSLTAVLVALFVSAGAARAGDYYVYSCSTYGNTAPAFVGYSNAAHLNTANACLQPAPGGGYRTLEINNPAGGGYPVQQGYSATWTAYAPAGVSIVGAYTPVNTVEVDCKLSSDGFTAEYHWAGSTQAINYINGCNGYGYGFADGISTSFAPSSWFGWAAGCYLKSSCTTSSSAGAVVGVQGIRLTAEENTGPALDAVPASNLWYAGGWVRGPWPITLDASDPSGVCVMTTVVDGQAVESWSDPSRDTSRFIQCHGSQLPGQLNTTSYSNGQHTLTFGASNAASVISAPSKTISVDNAPVSLSLSGPTDAPSTAGTQYVHAGATAGPSGVGAILCSVDGGPDQRFQGSSAQVPVSGLGAHQVACYAQNNAVDPSGAPASSPTETWNLTIREPTVSAIAFTRVVDALRCRKVRERVGAARHRRTVNVTRCHPRTTRRREVVWTTVRRHGKTVRVKRIKVVRVVLLPKTVAKSSRHIAFGHGTTVSGWLGMAGGTALAGQRVVVYTAPANGQNDFTPVGVVTTASDGGWQARLPSGPSRLVVAVYNGSNVTEPAASTAVRVIVPARITLSAGPQQLSWSGVLTLRGHLRGGYVPHDGVALRLLSRYPGSSRPSVLLALRTDSAGRFRIRWSFNSGHGTATMPFWISTTATETDYPFAAGASHQTLVTFGVPTPHHRASKHHKKPRHKRK